MHPIADSVNREIRRGKKKFIAIMQECINQKKKKNRIVAKMHKTFYLPSLLLYSYKKDVFKYKRGTHTDDGMNFFILTQSQDLFLFLITFMMSKPILVFT